MKKGIAFLLGLLLLGALAGCGQTQEDSPDAQKTQDGNELVEQNPSPWGVTLTVEDVSATGLTIVCTQQGGEPEGDLQTGSYYSLEALRDGQWAAVEQLPQEAEVGWTGEAWVIPMDDTVRWEVDWEWLYGALPAGEYRIGKEIMDFQGTGDYEQVMYYAPFTIQ